MVSEKNSVFISHSSVDKPLVDKLVAEISSIGVKVWYDKFDITLGDSVPGKINEGLSKAKYFIIVLSNASINSKWVQEELNAALMKQINMNGTFILPIKIGECEIPPLLSHRKYLNLEENYHTAIEELLDLLKKDIAVSRETDKPLYPWPDTKIRDENYLYLYSTRFDKFFKMSCDLDWTANKTIDYIVSTLNLPWHSEISELGMKWSFSYGLIFKDESISLSSTLSQIGVSDGDTIKINISGTYEDLFEKQLKDMWDGTKIYMWGPHLEENLKEKIRLRGVLNAERLRTIANSCFSHLNE